MPDIPDGYLLKHKPLEDRHEKGRVFFGRDKVPWFIGPMPNSRSLAKKNA
jgi:hypothetical protein